MKDTPISVLQDKISYYQKFIKKLETREGIVPNTNESPEETQKKFDGLIHDCRVKIAQFESAIEILRENNKWEKATVIKM